MSAAKGWKTWTEEEDGRLREMLGAGLRYEEIRQRLGRSVHSVKSRAIQIRLCQPKAPVWTKAEDWKLLGLAVEGITYAEIGQRLGRSAVAVQTRLRTLGHGGILRLSAPLTPNKLVTLLGVNHKLIRKWIRAGYLRTRTTRLSNGRGCVQAITWEDLTAFLLAEEHWHRVDLARITDLALRETAHEARRGHVFYTTRQAEAELGFAHGSVNRAIRLGRVRCVQGSGGDWLIRDDWLADLLAPRRERAPYQHLDAAALETVRQLWGQVPGSEIARRLGCADGTVSRVAQRLGLPALGRGCWLKQRARRYGVRPVAVQDLPELAKHGARGWKLEGS